MKVRNCVLMLVPGSVVQAIVSVPLAGILVAQAPVPVAQVPVPVAQVPVPVAQGPAAPAAVGQELAMPAPVGVYEMQGDAVVATPGVEMPTVEKLGGAVRYQLLNMAAIEIMRIEAAVKLDESQRSKLIAGSKGLVEVKAQESARFMTVTMVPVEAVAEVPVGATPVLSGQPPADQPPVKFEEVTSYASLGAGVKQILANEGVPGMIKPDDPEWVKLVQSVLKPEQYVKYEQTLAAQASSHEKAGVDRGIADLSVDLVLSEEQASQLRALVMEQMAKPKPKPAASSPSELSMGGAAVWTSSYLGFYTELAKVDVQKIREVLDPQQFALFDFIMRRHHRSAEAAAQGGLMIP